MAYPSTPNNREHAVTANWAQKQPLAPGQPTQDLFRGKGTSLDDDTVSSSSTSHSLTADRVAGGGDGRGNSGGGKSVDPAAYAAAAAAVAAGAPPPTTFANGGARAVAPAGGWGGRVASRMEEERRIAAENKAKSENAAKVAELRRQRRDGEITEEVWSLSSCLFTYFFLKVGGSPTSILKTCDVSLSIPVTHMAALFISLDFICLCLCLYHLSLN